MLQPNTAQPGHSVWDRVGRHLFEREIDALRRTNFVPEPRALQKENWPKTRHTDCLPFETEKQLADDIAFVSAYEYGVQYVTAATVQASKRDGLLVLLAANEGICDEVRRAWDKLMPLLKECTAKS